MKSNFEFLKPNTMKELGFDCVKDKNDGYFEYRNDGTKHYNKDYNKTFPEPKGKVIIYVNFTYGETPFIGITQDGDTRIVYNGVCSSKEFFIDLINNVR